jgi:4-hydroxy-3-polyprenylbenzoate decarboxylase
MGIDATRKWSAEGFTRSWPPMLKQDPAVTARIDSIWKKLGIE